MNGTVIVKDNVVVTVWEAGMLVKTYHVHNTWGTAGLNALRNWFAGLGGTPITHIAWVDTAGVERARDIVTQRLVTADKAVMFRQYLPSASSANGYTLNRIRAYNALFLVPGPHRCSDRGRAAHRGARLRRVPAAEQVPAGRPRCGSRDHAGRS
jgi:hypothetical protein